MNQLKERENQGEDEHFAPRGTSSERKREEENSLEEEKAILEMKKGAKGSSRNIFKLKERENNNERFYQRQMDAQERESDEEEAKIEQS